MFNVKWADSVRVAENITNLTLSKCWKLAYIKF